MKRVATAYSPGGCPVRVTRLDCGYQAQKEARAFAGEKGEGFYALIDFSVESEWSERRDDPATGSSGSEAGEGASSVEGAEAVEFMFVLFDAFDSFLAAVQGFAGPGRYLSGRKRHRARWVFEVDGAFSQYHALCFPSQVRLLDGRVWRCDREECVGWINEQMKDSGVVLSVGDVFLDGGTREGYHDLQHH